MNKIIGFLLLMSVSVLSASGQESDSELKESFLSAESYLLFEEYSEALPLYLKLHRAYPENNNYNYKIGVCYLKNPYEKNKAIYYLEKAVTDLNSKNYKENSFKETTAPLEALYYLGNAYMINNDLRKARDNYKKFLKMIDPEVYDVSLVNAQLEACDAAEKMMKKPIDFDANNLGEFVNTRFSDTNPVLSGDETKMAFVSKLQFYDAVFYSEKVNGQWSGPRNIIPELGVDGDVYPTCLSYDGTQMLVYRNDGFLGNIYSTRLVDGKWTTLEKLNDNINTKYWESHASLSKDGNTMYFTSNRTGGYGGLDIYLSRRQENGNWGPPLNLGSDINTKYNEETPFITEDGEKIFFSSYGHYNMGGYDIFMSVRKNDTTWAKPVNLGYPLNTTDDDLFFNPLKNSMIAYYATFNEEGIGKHDIYRYIIYTADFPRKYIVRGQLDYSGTLPGNSAVNIFVIDPGKRDTLARTNPDLTGKFAFELPEGRYNLIFESDRFEKKEQKLTVSKMPPNTEIILPDEITLKPLPVAEAIPEEMQKPNVKDRVVRSSVTLKDDSGFDVPYVADRGSQVVVNLYEGNDLISSDTTTGTGRRNQKYEFSQGSGANRITIAVTGKDGQTTINDIEIIYAKPVEGITDSAKITENRIPENDNIMIEALRQQMINQSSGELKKYLQELDLEKAGIKTSNDLIKNLYQSADKEGFTKADVDKLIRNSVSQKTLSQIITDLKKNSDGKLREKLENLKPDSLNIHTPFEISDYLVKDAENSDYKAEDVLNALAAIGENGSAEDFIKKLYHSIPDGPLKDYLVSSDISGMKFASPGELAIHLFNKAGTEAYSKDDVLKALTNAASGRDAERLRNELSLRATGKLKDLLMKIELEKEGIYTADELIEYLYEHADSIGYSIMDIDGLLQQYSMDQLNMAENLRQKMSLLSGNKLHEFLKSMDLNNFNIANREELIAFLKANAETPGFSADDVDSALLQVAFYGSLDNVIGKMIEISGGKLQKFLKGLDPGKEGIHTLDGLIQYLFDNAEGNGYSNADVNRLVKQITGKEALIDFIERLRQFAPASLRKLLDTLDIEKESITNINELLNYLISQSEIYGFTAEDIMQSIELVAMAESENAALPVQSRTSGGSSLKLSGLIMAGILLAILIIIFLSRRRKKKVNN